ncbi:MAG: hypothetical protein LBQ50_13925 [Planctomycetaceae bacterium]|jgi:hypothetical protein|nr:hypothetical protein [Planctomycetaceae bacterium]
MPTLHYELSVPEGGAVVLPPEFYGSKVVVIKKTPPLPENNDHWKHQKTLEELAEEQGEKRFTDPNRVFGTLSFLWDSKEEVEEFLRKRKEE